MASPLMSVLLKLSFSEASGPYDLGEEVPPLLNRPGYVFRLQENLRHILPRSHLETFGPNIPQASLQVKGDRISP